MARLTFFARGLLCGTAVLAGFFCTAALRGESSAESKKYEFRYRFREGETLRWEVIHRSRVQTTVSGTTQSAETSSVSTKVWRVVEVKSDGSARFEHLVEDVEMRQELSGRQPVQYNSKKDKEPPAGFGDVAGAIGVPLSEITLDAHGKILKREKKPVKSGVQANGLITLPLPQQRIAIGGTWSYPADVDVIDEGGRPFRIKTVQKFKLTDVRNGVATIQVATQILTPVTDPALESQLINCAAKGTVRFDLDAGRILGQQMDTDKHVVGFRGGASSVHYLTRFTEDFVRPEKKVARK